MTDTLAISDPANCVSLAVGFDDVRYALCLATALSRATPGHRLILVLNGIPRPSTDTLREDLADLPLKTAVICQDSNIGWAGGIQSAYEMLRNPKAGIAPLTVALWHDDMIPGANWAEALKHLEPATAGVIGLTPLQFSTVALEPTTETIDLFIEVAATQRTTAALEADVAMPYIVRCDAVPAGFPLLDVAFGPGGWADWDLFERLLAVGRTVLRTPSAFCYHYRVGRWYSDSQHSAIAVSRRKYLDRWERDGLWWKRITETRRPIEKD